MLTDINHTINVGKWLIVGGLGLVSISLVMYWLHKKWYQGVFAVAGLLLTIGLFLVVYPIVYPIWHLNQIR